MKIQDGCQSWSLIAVSKLFVLHYYFEATSAAINTPKVSYVGLYDKYEIYTHKYTHRHTQTHTHE